LHLIAETDGAASHATSAAFQRDRKRDQRALRAGHRVVRFTWWQVMHSPAEVVLTLRALLDQSAACTSSAARSPERTAPSM
jgi:very-short-patch-repair endonuclease